MANYLATLGWGPPDGVEIRPHGRDRRAVRPGRRRQLERLLRPQEARPLQRRVHPGPAGRRVHRPLAAVAARRRRARGPPSATTPPTFAAMAPLVQERVKTLAEVPGYVDFLFLDRAGRSTRSRGRRRWSRAATPRSSMLDAMADRFATCEWTVAGLEDALFGFGDAQEIKRGQAQAPIRVAVTGRTVGPPLLESLELLGRDATLARVRAAPRSSTRRGRPPRRSRRSSRVGPPAAGLRISDRAVARATAVGPGMPRWARRVPPDPPGRRGRARPRRPLPLRDLHPGVVGVEPGRPPPASAIIVLGAAQYNGEPSPVLQARLDHAAELCEAGVAPTIIVTGGKQEGDRVGEGYASYDELRRPGHPRVGAEGRGRRHQHLRAALGVEGDRRRPRRRRQRRGRVEPVPLVPVRRRSPTRSAWWPQTSPSAESSSLSSLGRETLAVSLGRIVSFRRLANWMN